MIRFNETIYDTASNTAVIGSGQVWDQVYTSLAPFKVNVVGGRVTGVGVAGFTLGGGALRVHSTHGLPINQTLNSRLFLADEPVWSHDRHGRSVRTRTAEWHRDGSY